MPAEVDYAVGLRLMVDPAALRGTEDLTRDAKALGAELDTAGLHGTRAMHQLGEGARHAHHETEILSRGAERLKGVLEGVAGVVGLELGFRGLAHVLVEANQELENQQRQMGGVVASYYQLKGADPWQNFQAGARASSRMLEDFQKQARITGISRETYASVADALAPGVAAAKKGTAFLTEMSETVSVLSRRIGAAPAEMAQELAGALEGFPRGRILRAIGISPRDVLGHTADQVVTMINKALGRFPVEAMKAAETMGERWGVMRAQLDEIYETAGKPVFKELSQTLADITGYLETHHEEVEDIAKIVGQDIKEAFLDIKSTAGFIRDHWSEVKAISETIAAIWAGEKMLGSMKQMSGLAMSVAGALMKIPGAAAAFGASAPLAVAGGVGLGMVGALGAGVISDVERYRHIGEDSARRREAAEDELVRGLLQQQIEQHHGSVTPATLWGAAQDALNNVADLEMTPSGALGAAPGVAIPKEALERVATALEKALSEGLKRSDREADMLGRGRTNITNHIQFNIDKTHDADEIVFTMADLFRIMAENPRQALKSRSNIPHAP